MNRQHSNANTGRAGEDQRHINRAYRLFRLFMAEMLQVRHTDRILDRIRLTMYTIENTLYEYVQEEAK